MKIQGTITALITPFKEGKIDLLGLDLLIRRQIEAGVDALLILGTTGEASTLTLEEQKSLITQAVASAADQIPIWVGTGSYATDQTILKTKMAHDLGATMALIVTPYYNRPTQEGIYRHFEAITQRVPIPIVIYNHPGRCGANIEVDTLRRLATLPGIVGIKECSGNLGQMGEILEVAHQTPSLNVLGGDDLFTLPMLFWGASGIVSVASNLLPKEVVTLVKACLKGELEEARSLQRQLYRLYRALGSETNPIPIKAALELFSLPSGGCRLPLCDISPSAKESLEKELACWLAKERITPLHGSQICSSCLS